jgi:hypothetical protein
MEVNYSGGIVNVSKLSFGTLDADGPAAFYATTTIADMLFSSQGLANNAVGDVWKSMTSDAGASGNQTLTLIVSFSQ